MVRSARTSEYIIVLMLIGCPTGVLGLASSNSFSTTEVSHPGRFTLQIGKSYRTTVFITLGADLNT